MGGKGMKVKIFGERGNAAQLEKTLNEWLEKNKNLDIKEIKQSIDTGGESVGEIIISIWYEKKKQQM